MVEISSEQQLFSKIMKIRYFLALTIAFLLIFSFCWQWIERGYVGIISSSLSAISPIEVDIEFDGIKIVSTARKIVYSDNLPDNSKQDLNDENVPYVMGIDATQLSYGLVPALSLILAMAVSTKKRSLLLIFGTILSGFISQIIGVHILVLRQSHLVQIAGSQEDLFSWVRTVSFILPFIPILACMIGIYTLFKAR